MVGARMHTRVLSVLTACASVCACALLTAGVTVTAARATAKAQRWLPAREKGAIALAFVAAGSAAREHTMGSTDAHCICYDACVLIAVRIKPEISPPLCFAVPVESQCTSAL